MKKWHVVVVILAVIAIGVGALFGGRAWGQSGSSDDQFQRPFAEDGSDFGNRGDGTIPGDGLATSKLSGNYMSGSIIAADSSTITIQTSDGSTMIVLIGESTAISLVTEGSIADLMTGEDVVVTGTTNDDGTVTATSIRMGEILSSGASNGAPPAESETMTTEATTE